MTFLYRCPTTGYRVQGFVADDALGADPNAYQPVECIMCGQTHLVNPKTGAVAGETSE